MSASTPPPPQGSSTGMYAGIAVLLLAGIGALIGWKTCNKTPDPPPTVNTVTPPPTAPPTNTLKIDDIPLPPPVDAGVDSGPVTTVRGPGPNPCEVKTCKGSASSDLEAALQFRAKQAHRCYDNALASDNTLQGKVTLNIKIGSNGAMCGVSVASNELSNAGVAQCVANSFRSAANFPAPKGGCVEINLPINFKPGGR